MTTNKKAANLVYMTIRYANHSAGLSLDKNSGWDSEFCKGAAIAKIECAQSIAKEFGLTNREFAAIVREVWENSEKWYFIVPDQGHELNGFYQIVK